jgi:hypothetical protein
MLPDHDHDRDVDAEFREGLWRGISAVYALVARARDAPGIRWTLRGLETGAYELANGVPPRQRSAMARAIVRELHRHEEYGRTFAFNLGLHASTFIALEVADQFQSRDAILAALDECEDIACGHVAGRYGVSYRGMAQTVLDELERRYDAYRDADESITSSYCYGD